MQNYTNNNTFFPPIKRKNSIETFRLKEFIFFKIIITIPIRFCLYNWSINNFIIIVSILKILSKKLFQYTIDFI